MKHPSVGLWHAPLPQVVLRPTARQARALDDLLRVQCELYNAALEEPRRLAR